MPPLTPNDAGADTPRDRHPAIGRPRHHRTRQTEDAVVGDSDGLVVVIERQDHQHRAEDLLLRDRGAVVDADDHRRRDEVSTRQVGWQVLHGLAADGDLRSVATRLADRASTRSFCAALITGPTNVPG